MAIPKIIHYCWLSDDPVPMDLQRYMETWKEKLYDYEFIKWDFTRFDINSSVWVKEAFENKKYAFAADYIRLYALYNYGGFYLDMDVEVLKSFDPLIVLDYAIGWEYDKDGLEVAAFGVKIGCEWIKDCLSYYNNRSFVISEGVFDTKTLPMIVRDVLINKEYVLEDANSVDNAQKIALDKDHIAVLPSDYFSPKSYNTGKTRITSRTFSVHHFSGSWKPTCDKYIKMIRDITGIRNTGLIAKFRSLFS